MKHWEMAQVFPCRGTWFAIVLAAGSVLAWGWHKHDVAARAASPVAPQAGTVTP